MILYDPNVPAGLFEFGIQIPIRDSRTTRTFNALKEYSNLGPVDSWHHDCVSATLKRNDLLRAHTPSHVEKLYSDQLENIITRTYELIDDQGNYFRYNPESATRPLADLFDRILYKAAGTFQCAQMALSTGFCYYFSGGMHHAHADHGSGFCMINDIVIAARKMIAEKGIRKVWIIDTDAHKGDGTAAITKGDDAIVTLSIHMAHGWPLDGPQILSDGTVNPAYTPSDIDIPIESGGELSYLEKLQKGLSRLDAWGAADLAIIVSGADPYEKDELPSTSKLKLDLEQLLNRDKMVYEFLAERRVPGAYLMAGGYGEKVWEVFYQFLNWALPKQVMAQKPESH
jgi:acetoin utilization deacetylase AcuC-like enzyme